MKIVKCIVTLSFCALFILTPAAFGGEAKVFSIKPSNSTEIKADTHHLDIIFITGWVSSKDNFFKSLLSSSSKTAAAISASGTYFDGDQLKNAWIVENQDVGNKLDRPWGIANKTLLSAIPADTLIPNIIVKFEIHKDDRLKQLLGLFKAAEPATGATVEPYLTYATMVDGFFTSMFGTEKTKYPFLMDVGLSDPSVKSAHGIYEHYIIGIAPSKDGDSWLDSLDGSKLSFNMSTKQLTYDGNNVTDHTYAVFLVQRAESPNVPQLLYNSRAPWAVLALGTFYQAPLPKIAKKEDIQGVETQYIKNLGDCVGLLQRELRFSAFDRASAMYAFAQRAAELVTYACKEGNVAQADCKTAQLNAYESGISNIFPLENALANDSARRLSQKLNEKIKALAQ